MMHEFVTYADGTLVVSSDIRKKENGTVVERGAAYFFETARKFEFFTQSNLSNPQNEYPKQNIKQPTQNPSQSFCHFQCEIIPSNPNTPHATATVCSIVP